MGSGDQPGYRRVAVVGAGVIGISWAAEFLAHGMQVTVCDPVPDVEERVRAGLREIAHPCAAGAARGRPHRRHGCAALRAGRNQRRGRRRRRPGERAQRPDLKKELWSQIEAGAPADALFASSSSSIPALVMGQAMREPGRLVIGHPFNPPHLVPLVEIVPSPTTDPDVVERAVAFYRALGKRPQVLSRGDPGFCGQPAAGCPVPRGRPPRHPGCGYRAGAGCSRDQLDRDAVGGGRTVSDLPPGGGPGGLADFLVHLGPALEALWKTLGQASFDADTVRLLTTQAEDFGGTVAELARRRDEAQIRLMKALDEIAIEG